jgi:DNA-binding CsgD family transcriptional regulator
LAELFPAESEHNASLPAAIIERLMQLRQDGAKFQSQPRSSLQIGGRILEVSVLSPIGPNELLFRLTEISSADNEKLLQEKLALTTREAEVLLWISRGKANREIGEILSISPRTVNKHLEQVFVKLGVENRASAAARAVRTMAHSGDDR